MHENINVDIVHKIVSRENINFAASKDKQNRSIQYRFELASSHLLVSGVNCFMAPWKSRLCHLYLLPIE
jgi:hypothetical protein